MAKDASFQQLVDMCNKIGWDTGLLELEKMVLRNENIQASLYAGDANQVRQAVNLSKIIIAQNSTIARLKYYRTENGL